MGTLKKGLTDRDSLDNGRTSMMSQTGRESGIYSKEEFMIRNLGGKQIERSQNAESLKELVEAKSIVDLQKYIK
jgi:hypothetical protein